MDEWVWWMIAAGVLAVGEISTLGFFLGPIAIAAAAAAVVALAGGGLALQWIVFIAVVARARCSSCGRSPRATCARRRRCAPAPPRCRQPARWCSSGSTRDGGQVKIGGEVWSARSYDEDEVFEPGTRVEVMKIDGATALVSE